MRGVLTDVTPRYAAEEREHAAELSYRTVVETAVDAFVGIDTDGRVNEWNPAAERLLGFDRQDVIGQSLRDLIIPPAYRAAHDAAVARRGTDLPTGPLMRRELEALCSDGSLVPIELQVSAVRSGDTVSFAAFLRDLTQRKEYERRLARKALTDPLTGLPNRELLLTRLTEALAAAAATPAAGTESGTAVLFVDVDRFKVVNDSLGHAVGDRLLVTLGERLRTAVRPGETLGRFGGDEFVVLSPGVSDRAEAVVVARRLRAALAEPLDVDGRLLAVDLSVGIAISAPGEVAPEALLRDADAAMYAAKVRTGDSVVVFDDTLRGQVVERLALERELRDALDSGALDVHYQPVLTLDGELVGFEALARWDSPLRGMVPPTTFVPLAEETGLIGRLGAYVLDEACAQLAAWQHAMPGLQNATMAVNLSGRQLADAQLVETVSEVLGRNGLAPDLLCLEITENVLADEGEAGSLVRLRDLGVRLAIDDFGTGYSSLVSLRRLPVDVLKLDRLFVAGLGSNVSDTAIVRCGIDLAHALGMTVVAEGVETAQQLTVLRTLGCDNAQGYWWSRPLPAGQVGAWLQSDRPVPAAGSQSPTVGVGSGRGDAHGLDGGCRAVASQGTGVAGDQGAQHHGGGAEGRATERIDQVVPPEVDRRRRCRREGSPEQPADAQRQAGQVGDQTGGDEDADVQRRERRDGLHGGASTRGRRGRRPVRPTCSSGVVPRRCPTARGTPRARGRSARRWAPLNRSRPQAPSRCRSPSRKRSEAQVSPDQTRAAASDTGTKPIHAM